MVGESEIGDASKVQVYGDGISHCAAGQTAEFFVDTRRAGIIRLKFFFPLLL